VAGTIIDGLFFAAALDDAQKAAARIFFEDENKSFPLDLKLEDLSVSSATCGFGCLKFELEIRLPAVCGWMFI